MKSVVSDVLAFCRMFALFERDQICCGTVTPSQCVLLQSLREQSSDVSALAKQAGVTKGAMTRLIDGLEKRKLVQRERAEDDGRRVLVSLTPSGKKEAARLTELAERSILGLVSRVPAKERAQVARSLRLLREAAENSRSGLRCC